MKSMKGLKNLGIIYIGVLILLSMVWGNRYLSSKAEQSSMAEMDYESQNNPLDDPCWFNTREGINAAVERGRKGRDFATLAKIRNRQLYGFEEVTPISEAVKLFNLEKIKCVPYLKEFPPLTEDELIAAIVVGVNGEKRGTEFHTERDAFWKIVTSRMMPIGSVLSAHNGGNIQNSPLAPYKTINAKGIEIFLLLGADKNGRTGLAAPSKPEEILVIRKTFYGIEIGD